MRSHLSPLDGVFLELEQADDAAHIHLGWTMIFDPLPGGARPSLSRLREQVRRRLLGNSNPRRRLSTPRIGMLAQPVWLPDPDFDIGQLVRSETLASPGGEAELMAWLSSYFERRLDRELPLWEAVLLEGLEGDRWAIVFKVHRCLIDGISGASIMAALADVEAGSELGSTALMEMVASLGNEADRGVLFRLRGAVGEQSGGGIDAPIHPRKVASIISRSRDMAAELAEELSSAPRIRHGGGGKRTMASIDVPLEDLWRVKEGLGGGAGDVLLAMLGGGLQRLFDRRGEEVDRVRVLSSATLRRATESIVLGNDVAPLLVDLPTSGGDGADPPHRYRRIVEATNGAAVEGKDALINAAGHPPALVQSVYARLAHTPNVFDVAVTPVPSMPISLYALGAPMRRIIPTVPLFSGNALALAAVNYRGRLYLGFSAEEDAFPDLDVLCAGVAESLADLATVAA